MFSLSSISYYSCNSTFSTEYLWTVTKIDKNVSTQIDLSLNPTSKKSEIVFQSNTLDYGLYEINLQVTKTPLNLPRIKSNASTFVQIEPSDISVYGLLNGINTLRIGLEQTLSFDPRKYSNYIDKQEMNPLGKLNFTFYCNPLNGDLVSLSITDLLTLKKSGSYSPCFISNGKIFKYISDTRGIEKLNFIYFKKDFYSFDSSGNILTFNGSSFIQRNYSYQFSISTVYNSKKFSQIILIELDSSTLKKIPIANLK
jgi:hypothetical protein